MTEKKPLEHGDEHLDWKTSSSTTTTPKMSPEATKPPPAESRSMTSRSRRLSTRRRLS